MPIKLGKQVVDEALIVQHLHSILVLSKLHHKIHDGHLRQYVQQIEEVLENLREHGSCDFLAKSF